MATQSRPILILTRPEAASQRFAAQVRDRLGDKAPEILISPLMVPEFRAPELPPLPWGGVIFTSETGVEGLARLTADRSQPAFCVGPRTAQAARAAGWVAQDMGGDAATMLPRLVQMRPPGRIVHARGADVAADLAGALTAEGLHLAEVVVYAQRACALSTKAQQVLDRVSPVVFAAFSPRSAGLIVAQATGARAPLWLVAISPAAAQALAPLSAVQRQVATRPDASSMIDSLAYLVGAT